MVMVLPKSVIEKFSQANDPKKVILETIGDLSGRTPMFNTVLVAIFIRPEKTKGGIIRPVENLTEDVYQSKVGLVLKLGKKAFQDDDYNKFDGEKANVGDWVVFKIGDSWQVQINGVPCRLIEDANIKMVVTDPTSVF
jgi:co-chaperonin GroES (HSP10)